MCAKKIADDARLSLIELAALQLHSTDYIELPLTFNLICHSIFNFCHAMIKWTKAMNCRNCNRDSIQYVVRMDGAEGIDAFKLIWKREKCSDLNCLIWRYSIAAAAAVPPINWAHAGIKFEYVSWGLGLHLHFICYWRFDFYLMWISEWRNQYLSILKRDGNQSQKFAQNDVLLMSSKKWWSGQFLANSEFTFSTK